MIYRIVIFSLILATPATAQVAPKSFDQCSRCHSVTADGKNKAGPGLYRILGAPAAKVTGFKYSAALTEAAVRWDEKTLNAWITNPKAVVPGNNMRFGGEKDAAKRAEIIAWLKAN
ncbi:MAG: cytochrome c family protein [Pseudomonadota bacterium]